MRSYQSEAMEWIESNPEGFAAFERFAREAIAAGAKRIGAKFLAERVRWETTVVRRGKWKLNNNHTAYIARELALRHPEIGELMSFREVQEA